MHPNIISVDVSGKELIVKLTDGIAAENTEDITNEVRAKADEVLKDVSDDSKANREVDTLVFDLTNVKYISSAGLRMFADFSMEMEDRGCDYEVRNVPREKDRNVYRVFELTGYTAAYKLTILESD
jgi:anti-anti-sigma factor